MKSSDAHKISRNLILPAVSLLALVATFFTANLSLDFQTKLFIFFAIVAFYILFCVFFYFRRKREILFFPSENRSGDLPFTAEIEAQLLALEEASEFFGAALKPADMFRLVSSRINQMITFSACALFFTEEKPRGLKIVNAVGTNAREMTNVGTVLLDGLAGKSLASNRIEFDGDLLLEKTALPANALTNLESAVAAPLLRNGTKAFGVLTLYWDKKYKFDENTETLLEAIAERIAPLFLSSVAFERSISSALTDSLTSVPNERGFYLILENQIAESQRRRDERPLTILAVDLKGFAELNERFGHATGDRILAFASEIIKGQLRKMDFISRARADEFLIVLPTATESVTHEIVERIETASKRDRFEVSDDEKICLEFNFGAATFWKDGETAQELLTSARLKKQNGKFGNESNVLLFPREFVN